MTIQFDPHPGMVLMCNFGTCFKEPEMRKNRPVVVVSRKLRHRANLCTIIPLSTKVPDVIMGWHHKLEPQSVPVPFRGADNWAKCDMITTVAYHRMDRIMLNKRGPNGKRVYSAMSVTNEDLKAIKNCILTTLNLGK